MLAGEQTTTWQISRLPASIVVKKPGNFNSGENMKPLSKQNKGTKADAAQLDLHAKAEHQKQLTRQEVAETAYLKSEQRGFLPGYELSDWLEAEQKVSLT
jgi:hypothetical protein